MKLRFAAGRLLALVRKRRLDGELEGEILAHLEMAERDAIAAGLSPEEARHAARRRFRRNRTDEGRSSRSTERPVGGEPAERLSIRDGFAGAGSRIRRGYHRIAGSRHRRQHGHVQYR